MDVITHDHSSMIYAKAIQHMTALLAPYGITYFCFIREYTDRARICLTSHPQWHSHFANTSIYKDDFFTIPDQSLDTGYFLWNDVRCNKIYLSARDHFSIDHGIALIEKSKDYTDQFHFGGPPGKLGPTDYIACTHTIKAFAADFLHKARRLITRSDRIMLPELATSEQVVTLSETPVNDPKLGRIYVNYVNRQGQQAYITQAEKDCLRWLVKGKSLTEIAVLRGTSQKVVDKQMAHLKAKFDCKGLPQLVYRLMHSLFADIIFDD